METALTHFPLGKPIATGSVKIFEGRPVVRVFSDTLFSDFRVYKTGGHRLGFWEEEPSKVQKLIDAFKGGHNLKNALIYAGVKEMAWYRFLEAYPSFREVKEACEASTSFGAMNSVQEGLKNIPELAFRYIEKRGDFNFPTRKVDDAPVQPSVAVAVQVNNNIDEGKLKTTARILADGIIADKSRQSTGDSRERVAGAV